MTRPLRILLAAGLALGTSTPPGAAQAHRPAADPALGLIRPEWISAHVRFLADARLRGRETARPGAEIAARYVAAEFGELGLEPLDRDSSFLAPVPLRHTVLDSARTTVTLTVGGRPTPLALGRDVFVHPDKRRTSVDLSGGLVFVGWGVTAPGYDDYRDVDATGKFAVMLFGGPPSLPSDQRGHYATLAMKERNALAHGAVGVVTLLPAPPALVADKLGQLEDYAWLDPDGTPNGLFFESGVGVRLTDAGTARLLGLAGRTLPEVAQGLAKSPLSFPIEGTLAVHAEMRQDSTTASNVAGLLRGADPTLRDQYLVYTAHLDHVGVGTPVAGDSVYHGAIDNAGGTAVLMALARAWTGLPRPRRSILFVAVTGEEKGILGSDYLAHHPPVPRERIVADLNLDNFVMIMPVRDFVAYGANYSTLGADARAAFRILRVTESDDPIPGQTVFTRSDHYPFMRLGIPALMLFPGKASGLDGRSGTEVQQAWFDHIHHTPHDRYDQPIDWQAGVAFAEANLLIGRTVANRTVRPRWIGEPFFLTGGSTVGGRQTPEEGRTP